MESAYIWMGLGIICLIIEMFTGDFFFATIGISALIGGIPAYMGVGLPVQVIVFAVSAIIIFVSVRPFVKKLLQGKNHAKERGLNTLIDKTGIVTEDIVNSENKGYVKIDGDLWKAVSETGENIEKGTQICVKKVESTIVFVERR